eukprot:TRINITY_DN2203_c0_g1_i2.p1 TRINITY_DN2203_c0_g1~~TRINITY_DN2203_c0_g1_i2.p1  ORF type:complete len:395 (-),score=106.09 TRINITY_DN2203_c0_g1_i2:41-1225(-)
MCIRDRYQRRVLGKEEGEGEEKPDLIQERLTTLKAFKDGLSQLTKSKDNVGFIYGNVNVEAREPPLIGLFDALKIYNNLKFVNISNNKIKDLTQYITGMHGLVVLNASKNAITDIQFLQKEGILQYLQIVNLSGNKIQQFGKLQLPRVRKLNLSDNRIKSVAQFEGHGKLELLELRKNKLKTLDGIQQCPCLEELYVDENLITDWNSLKGLPKLKTLHLRDNKIRQIREPLPYLPQLFHLNLRGNMIKNFNDIKLLCSKLTIKSLNVIANPVVEESTNGLKKDILYKFTHLIKINKEEVTSEEIQEMKSELKGIEEEEERKRQEEEEQRKQEEEETRQREEEEAKQREEELREQQLVEEEERKKLEEEGAGKEQEEEKEEKDKEEQEEEQEQEA